MSKKNEKESESILLAPLKVMRRVLRGQVITSDFFTRHWLIILVIISMIMVYITNKYNCQRSMEEIRDLKKELEHVQTEAMRQRSAYMSKITEQAMQERLDSLHLDLKVQDQPPFKLSPKK